MHPPVKSRRTELRRIVLIVTVGLLLGSSLGVLRAAGWLRGGTSVHDSPGGPSAATLGSETPDGTPILNESTLVLFNNSLLPGDLLSSAGRQPSLEVYDPETNEVFVEGFYSGIIDVLSGTSNQVVNTIRAGPYANTLAYDPVNNNVYFGLQTDDEVSVVNASTDLTQRTVGIGFEPLAMAANPVTGNVLVTGWYSTGTAFAAVINGSYGTVQSTFSFGSDRFPIAGPNGLAYDPATGDFYIASIASGLPAGRDGNLTIVNGTSFAVVTNLSLPFLPASILYAAATSDFYLGNASGKDLVVFDPSTAEATGAIALPNTPGVLAYGAGPRQIYVGIDGNVSVVNLSTGSVARTFAVLRQPSGLAFDPVDGDLYVSDYVWNNVSVVDLTTYRAVDSVLLGALPYFMAYDGANGDLYVVDVESSQLIVVNASGNRVVGYVPIGATPNGIAYDPETKEVYVTELYDDNVSIVNGTTNTVVGHLPTGKYPWSIAYDGADGDLYVSNGDSYNLSVLDPVTRTVEPSVKFIHVPSDIAYDPYSSTLYVGDYFNASVSVLNATTNAFVGNASVGTDPYTIAVDPVSGHVFVGNYGSDNVTVLGANGQDLNLSAAAGVGVYGSAYDPTTGDVFVASYESDLITVINGSTGVGIGGYAAGSGPVEAAVDPVTATVYVSNYDSGSLTVLSPSLLAATFAVSFEESGLAAGTPWSVRLDGSGRSSETAWINFTEPNGADQAYSVGTLAGYHESPEFGSVDIAGSAATVTITFRAQPPPAEFAVTFTESGLAIGTSWSVTFFGAEESASTATIVFETVNGTDLPFSIGPIPGYRATPHGGALDVDGAPVGESISFAAVTYSVTFEETGLPVGAGWTVTFNGVRDTGTASTFGFTVANGTFAFTVSPSIGYTANRTAGMVGVSGAPRELIITYSANTTAGAPPPRFSGTEETAAVVAGVLVVAAVAGLLLWRRARAKRPGGSGEEPVDRA
jgi:YVTN family beta-propeller protein